MAQDRKTGPDQTDQGRLGSFRFDRLLPIFLAVGWSVIFVSATLALRRDTQQWLPVKLAPRVSADYSVDAREPPKLAPVRPQVIEVVRQDARDAEPLATPTVVAQEATNTPVPLSMLIFPRTPTSTPSPQPSPLTVSAGGPYSGNEGSLIAVTARSAAPAAAALTYRWDLDDDGQYDDAWGNATTLMFYDDGEYRISIQVTDSTGRVATDFTTVRVRNVAPSVNAGKDRETREGEEISFAAAAKDPGHDEVSYYWDFGDGTEAIDTLDPRHTYLDNDDYIVRFWAEDDDGGVGEASFVTHVSNLPPEVEAGPDQAINEGDTVTFSGIATDPGVLDTLTYEWDFDYDGVNFAPDAPGDTASAIYSDGPATVMVALRVQDKDGAQAIDTLTVTVGNVAPTILGVTDDGPVAEGSPVTLEVDATDVGSDTLTFAFDWDNDGDFDPASQDPADTRILPDQGDYTVGILVDDGDAGTDFATAIVSAYNVSPSADAGPAIVRFEGAPVTFDGSGSSDPGVHDLLTYQWDFGDGSPLGSGITATHVYADNNAYSATLTVTDNSGEAGADAVTVTILNANPIAEAGPDYEAEEGRPFNLTGTASDPGAADVLSFAWDFDFDGSNFSEDATGMSSVDLTYPDGPAEHTVAFRVRDDDYPYPLDGGGEIGESIDTLRVTVKNLPPIDVGAGGPYQGHAGQAITLSGTAMDVPDDPLTYRWDLDQDGTFDLTGQTVVTSWNTNGVYTITLRVRDDDGDSGRDTARVTISNQPPIIESSDRYTGTEGIPLTLAGSAIDPDGDQPLTYTWDLDYDSTFETLGRVVTYTWPDNGRYTVTLRVDDGWGGVTTNDATVVINNLPPTADARGPYTATVGITKTLRGEGTDVPADTLTFTWDLDDDGVFETPGRTVSYTWTATGTYTVTLYVEDDDGESDTDTTTVEVNLLVPFAWLGVSYYLVRKKGATPWRKRRHSQSNHPDGPNLDRRKK